MKHRRVANASPGDSKTLTAQKRVSRSRYCRMTNLAWPMRGMRFPGVRRTVSSLPYEAKGTRRGGSASDSSELFDSELCDAWLFFCFLLEVTVSPSLQPEALRFLGFSSAGGTGSGGCVTLRRLPSSSTFHSAAKWPFMTPSIHSEERSFSRAAKTSGFCSFDASALARSSGDK